MRTATVTILRPMARRPCSTCEFAADRGHWRTGFVVAEADSGMQGGRTVL